MDSLSPWAPMKALSALVEAAVLNKRPGLRHDLETALKRHKPHFIALLKNPPRNPGDADLVRKAQTEGISLSSGLDAEVTTTVQKLPPQVVEEAIVVADMFNLNEIVSLQLLLKGRYR